MPRLLPVVCEFILICLLQGVPMNLKLLRLDATKHGIFGELIISNNRFKTVERLYHDNQPFISSVPPGVYTLEPHISDKHGETWALVNEAKGVYHWKHRNAKRYAILIHVANQASQLAGCIGLGKHLGFIKDEIAVTSSRVAVGEALKLLSRDVTHTLEIVNKI
jgi:hypothetical protein